MLRFAQCDATAFLFFALLSLAAAAVIAFLLSFSQTQRNISINGAMLEASSSFPSHFFFIVSCSMFLLSLIHVGKSPSTFMSLSLPPPLLVHLSFLWFLCNEIIFLTTHSPSFFSSSHSLLMTAHNRCDKSFDCHFCICSSMYFRFPLCTVFTTIRPLIDTYFIVQFVVIDSSGTLCFMWIQYLTYSILLLWNLSSASIDLVIFIFSSQFFFHHIR